MLTGYRLSIAVQRIAQLASFLASTYQNTFSVAEHSANIFHIFNKVFCPTFKEILTLWVLARARPTVLPTRHTDAAISSYGYKKAVSAVRLVLDWICRRDDAVIGSYSVMQAPAPLLLLV